MNNSGNYFNATENQTTVTGFDHYKNVFIKCLWHEIITVPEVSKKFIVEAIENWYSFKPYMLGSPEALSSAVENIFNNAELVSFVFGLTTRFMTEITDDQHSEEALLDMLFSWVTKNDRGAGFILAPQTLPVTVRNSLYGISDEFNYADIVKTNKFLLVPIMVYHTQPVINN